MFTDKILCNKCGIYIISQNKLIHDAQCNSLRNTHRRESIRDNHIHINSLSGYSSNIRINFNNQNNIDEEFWYCTQCQNYLDYRDKEDHILSHQFQDEDLNQDNLVERKPDEINREPNSFALRYNGINRNDNININNTNYRNNPNVSNYILNTNPNPFMNNMITNRNNGLGHSSNPIMNSARSQSKFIISNDILFILII